MAFSGHAAVTCLHQTIHMNQSCNNLHFGWPVNRLTRTPKHIEADEELHKMGSPGRTWGGGSTVTPLPPLSHTTPVMKQLDSL
ncbi:hypothetical protein C5F59_034455 [Streptomyces sp. QL37]|uniref:hypothetical protein n=1 Tax=Streptomyces sp. QL37 TaxID=2093747 RepID=UPI0011B0F27B|nr:hypothetical protein [Streptomyces sp. QL37]